MNTTDWQIALTSAVHATLQQLSAFLPQLLAATALVILGWLVATLIAKLTRKLLGGLGKLTHRLLPHSVSAKSQGVPLSLQPQQTAVAGKLIFWLVMLVFIAAAAQMLGLVVFSRWMADVVAYLPRLIAGLLIIFGGHLLSKALNIMATSTAASAGLPPNVWLGKGVQWTTFFTALVIGIEQLGINIQFITQFFIVISAVLVAGLALAFGVGARTLMANLLAAQQAQKHCQPGNKLRFEAEGGKMVEGILIEMSAVAFIIETEQGRLHLPAKLFLEHPCYNTDN